MFHVSRDKGWNLKLWLSTCDRQTHKGWHNYCALLWRQEKGCLEQKVETQPRPHPWPHPPVSEKSTRGAACDTLPDLFAQIWGNLHSPQAWGWVFCWLCISPTSHNASDAEHKEATQPKNLKLTAPSKRKLCATYNSSVLLSSEFEWEFKPDSCPRFLIWYPGTVSHCHITPNA